jgi:hypothetical protein
MRGAGRNETLRFGPHPSSAFRSGSARTSGTFSHRGRRGRHAPLSPRSVSGLAIVHLREAGRVAPASLELNPARYRGGPCFRPRRISETRPAGGFARSGPSCVPFRFPGSGLASSSATAALPNPGVHPVPARTMGPRIRAAGEGVDEDFLITGRNQDVEVDPVSVLSTHTLVSSKKGPPWSGPCHFRRANRPLAGNQPLVAARIVCCSDCTRADSEL